MINAALIFLEKQDIKIIVMILKEISYSSKNAKKGNNNIFYFNGFEQIIIGFMIA